MTWLASVLVILTMAGCSLNNMPLPAHNYRPVPNDALYARLTKLPGVASVSDMNWTNGFDTGNGYGGEIHIKRGAEPLRILDEVIAVLWQGQPGAAYGAIQIFSGVDVPPLSASQVVGLFCHRDLIARYGPQPGTGKPPAHAPPLQRGVNGSATVCVHR